MSSYKPYLVYDMKSGLRLDKAPWLLPQDAFEKLEDCYLQKGVLKKRHGYTHFADFVHVDNAPFGSGAFGAGKFGIGRVETKPGYAIMGIYNFYYGNSEQLLVFDTQRANKYNTATDLCDDLTTLNVRFKSGQTQILAGDTITGATSGDTAIVIATVLGNGAWADSDASGTLVLSSASAGDFEADGENITVHGSTVAALTESCSLDEFTGDDSNFFWFENWRSIGYITNNVDQIRKYNGSYLTKYNIDLDVEGGPDNDINTCLMIFHMKGRMVLLSTTERGVSHKQRIRWAQINSTTFRDADWLDAPRDDWIVAADFIGGDLIVWFERGVMKVVYTGDPDTPFRWEEIDSVEGCYATMSLVSFSDEMIGVGPTRFVSCDGREVRGVDEKIPDLMLTMNQSAIGYCYGIVIEEMRQALISYPSADASKPNKTLVLNYEEDNFSIFNLPAHVFGYSALLETIALDDMVGISLDDLDYSLDDKELQAGYPTSLMGCRDGKLYQLNDGGSDDGEAIEMKAKGGRWNPFIKDGMNVRFGSIDFLVDRASTTFDVRFFKNNNTSSYLTKTVDCSDDDISLDRVWRRAGCGAVGSSHQIEIVHNTTGISPGIHAFKLHFKPAGPI